MKKKYFTIAETTDGFMTVTYSNKSLDSRLRESLKEDFVPNKLFDEIMELDDKFHKIKLSKELRELYKGHVCMCGSLIPSSFLPHKTQIDFHQYVNRKGMHEIVKRGVEEITNTVNRHILEKMNLL